MFGFMFEPVENFVEAREKEFNLIPHDRKLVLDKIAGYIAEMQNSDKPVNLVYICTHNSRRSHFGQVAALVGAEYYGIQNVSAFSGGTEETAFHKNAIDSLKKIGFEIETKDQSKNPAYIVRYSSTKFTTCFSKMYDHPSNPDSKFLAVMTCSEAEKNCPFVPGASWRISTPYEDPKIADDTLNVNEVYTNRFAEILRETLFVFSRLNKK